MTPHHKGYPANTNVIELARLERARLDRLRANLAAEFERFDRLATDALHTLNMAHADVVAMIQCRQRVGAEIHTAGLQAEIAEADEAGRAL